jgi:hypothetical protein
MSDFAAVELVGFASDAAKASKPASFIVTPTVHYTMMPDEVP